MPVALERTRVLETIKYWQLLHITKKNAAQCKNCNTDQKNLTAAVNLTKNYCLKLVCKPTHFSSPGQQKQEKEACK